MQKASSLLILTLLGLAGLLVACQRWPFLFGNAPVHVSVTVVPVTQSAFGPPPTPVCSPLPAGMGLTATVAATGIVVEVTGLQPGELPEFHYSHTPADRFSVTPGQPVGADGRAVDQTYVRTRAQGTVSELWDIRVIHARGVACTQLVLQP